MKSNAKAYLGIITSMLIFGTIGIFRRYIPLSSGLLAFTRGIIGTIFIYLYMKIKGRKRIFEGIDKKTLALLCLLGVLIGANWILLFESYSYTTVATATLCYYMEPTIVILLSPIFLKEKLTVKKVLYSLVAIVGMVFISGIFEEGTRGANDGKGVLFGLLAAVMYSVVMIINKKISFDDPYIKTTVQLFFATAAMIPYLLLTDDFSVEGLGGTAILLVAVLGIVHTGFAYLLYFICFGKLKAQSVALLSYIDPVSALILSALVLKEHIGLFGIIGAVLIIGSALLSERE